MSQVAKVAQIGDRVRITQYIPLIEDEAFAAFGEDHVGAEGTVFETSDILGDQGPSLGYPKGSVIVEFDNPELASWAFTPQEYEVIETKEA